MTKFDPQDIKRQWKELFGTDGPTVLQAWFLVKLSKHVRGRCRSNAAFNNFFNAAFPNLRFKDVPKQNDRGEEYDGLEITEK